MKTFTPIWSTLVSSSVWRLDKDVKILWITMLVLKDDEGLVESSVPGLAAAAGLTVEETEKALQVLESPDKHSRTKSNEGRKIRACEDGWFVLNHEKYRDQMQKQKEYNAQKQKRYRDKLLAKKFPKKSKPAPGEVNYVKVMESMPEGTDHFSEQPVEYVADSGAK